MMHEGDHASGETSTYKVQSSSTWESSMRSASFASDDQSASFSDLARSMSVRTDVDSTFAPGSRRVLDETQQSWLLQAPGNRDEKKKMRRLMPRGCSRRRLVWAIVCVFVFVAALSLIVWKVALRTQREVDQDLDEYAVVLRKALTFFDIQKSGDLQSASGRTSVSWRASSGLSDGDGTLSGGYYDAGDNIKFTFTTAYAMTLLSWSVIEYKAKFMALGELNHAKELIKWGSDYLLKTFNSSALDRVVCQVGTGGGEIPNDHYCWERPEDLDYMNDTRRSAIAVRSGSDLAGEMAAALASASIVFKSQASYAQALRTGAEALYRFARERPALYVNSSDVAPSERTLYNSSSFGDELVWGSAWLYFATGNLTYLDEATVGAAHAFGGGRTTAFGAFDWDSKLVGAQMLLTRLRMLQGPGYPYEQVLQQYNDEIVLVVCAYLPQFQTFPRTRGGLIIFNANATQHLPAAVNAAFLATLYADYLKVNDVPVVQCGPNWFSPDDLRNFSRTQVDYILGKNRLQMSYVVGHGEKFPVQPHHRAASFPAKDSTRYGCEQGWKWRDRDGPNPHVLEGAMVGGPDVWDRFVDARHNSDQNEPTLVGNAGLVGALVALVSGDQGIDPNSIFSAGPGFVAAPPPASPWTP